MLTGTPYVKCRDTKATAVSDGATRAASDEFCGFVKIKPVAGQSPQSTPTPLLDLSASAILTIPFFPLKTDRKSTKNAVDDFTPKGV